MLEFDRLIKRIAMLGYKYYDYKRTEKNFHRFTFTTPLFNIGEYFSLNEVLASFDLVLFQDTFKIYSSENSIDLFISFECF